MWLNLAILLLLLLLLLIIIGGMVIYDLTQTKHAILRNFPVIGHFRYWLDAIRQLMRPLGYPESDPLPTAQP